MSYHLFSGDNLTALGENEHLKKSLLSVAAAAVSDHGTNNNLCTAATMVSMASANGGHMSNLEGHHLGMHGLTHHGKENILFIQTHFVHNLKNIPSFLVSCFLMYSDIFTRKVVLLYLFTSKMSVKKINVDFILTSTTNIPNSTYILFHFHRI